MRTFVAAIACVVAMATGMIIAVAAMLFDFGGIGP